MLADKITDHIHQSFRLSLCHKLRGIDALRQEANIVQVKMTLANIEALLRH